MKTFTDPINKIPPLLESDINSKIIISKMCNNDILLMNYMIKGNGVILTKDYDIKKRYTVIWSPECSYGKTVLDVIIKQYKVLLPQGYKMLYSIIESGKELKTFIKRNQIENTKLETGLLEHWKQLKENKNVK